MTRYIITKEETCPTCKGEYETKNPNYSEEYNHASEMYGDDAPSHYFPKEKFICTNCEKGTVRTEVQLETALKHILQVSQSALANDLATALR